MAHDADYPLTLGRYRLVHPLGRGAYGTVYKAVQSGPGQLQRTVALKVLNAGAASLWHEARLGGLLRHPHLVDVYEVGEADGRAYCAMEWCEGGALSSWAPLPAQAVIDAGIQACSALAYAHETLGIVHLDVKPENLLLSRDGVKVGDWGISRPQGVVPASGTKGFMAPEQRRGDHVDARADIYALGITLARLALGDLAAAAALTYQPSTGALATLDLHSPSVRTDAEEELTVPDWLKEVVSRCVQPEPADRYPTMHALADALGRLEVEGPGLRELVTQGSPSTGLEPENQGPGPVALFGRDEVLDRLDTHLSAKGGMVTLKGPPGVGKSQVARAVAARWAERGVRVVWCDLVGVDRLDEALLRLARQLGAPVGGGAQDELLKPLARLLQGMGDTLVVFDDAGHHIDRPDALAHWAPGPDVRWLITSRHPLRLPGEQVIDLPPLTLAACRDLFWAAAQRRGVTPASHEGLDTLFERLDRLPLSIELVAGRLGVLSIDEIVANSQLDFLRSSRQGRHATLHSALAFSWDPLSAVERGALQALTAFHSGIAMPAIETVLAPLGDPLALLKTLSECSLLRAEGNRFAVLGTVRDYVREVGPDRSAAEVAHGAYLASFGDAAGRAALWSHGGQRRWELLAESIDDADLACRRAVERGDGATACACLRAWWEVGALRGPFARGVSLADRVLTLEHLSAAEEAAAAVVRGHALRLSGALDDAERSLKHAIDLCERDGLSEEGLQAAVALAGVLVSLSRVEEAFDVLATWVARADGVVPAGLLAVALAQWGTLPDPSGDARAERLARAASLARTSGHRRPEGMAMQVLGALDHMGNRRERAERRYRAALRVFDEIGDRRFSAIVASNLAMLLAAQGRHEQVLDALHEALHACLEMGDRRQEVVVRIAIGDAYLCRGDGASAVPSLEAARALAGTIGVTQRAAAASLALARAWALVGDAKRANDALHEAVVQHPIEEADLLTVRGHLALSLGDRAAAVAHLEQARSVADDHHAEPIAQLAERLQSMA